MTLKNKKENLLVYTAAIGILLGMVALIIFNEENYFNSRLSIQTSFEVYALAAIIFAPLLEETTFRGLFATNKYLRVVSILAQLIVLIMIFDQNAIGLIVGAISLAYGIWAIVKKPNTSTLRGLYFLNAFFFASLHYSLEDFQHFSTASPILFQFSFGLIFIWLVINYSLRKSILAHFSLNLILLFFGFLSLQIVDKQTHLKTFEKGQISWSQTPLYPKINGSISIKNASITIHNMGVLKALEVLENLKHGDQKELEVFTAPFIKYNFQVSFNEDLNQEEVYLETIRALAKAQIIKLKEAPSKTPILP